MSALHVRELTPRGSGGVSVIELSGDGARAALEALCGEPLRPGALRFVRVRAAGEELDEALAWCERDDRAELQLHGSAPVVRRVLELLGPPQPEPGGESLAERAARRLADAPCEQAARILLDQSEGALERELAGWGALDDAELLARVSVLALRSHAARFALEPARVVLAGPVNAGKSTLFNLLHGRERVIVSAQAGTTRDAVRERVQLGHWPIELIDTAGERGGGGELERRGQELAREVRRAADLTLWLSPQDAPCAPPPASPDAAPTVVLASRADLAAGPAAAPAISVLRDPRAALAAVEAAFRAALELPERAWEPGAPVAFEPGQRAALARAQQALAAGQRAPAEGELELLRTPAR